MQNLTALLLTLLITGCAFPGVYKINVQQGNILTEEELTSLSEGMSKGQVRSILGTPLIVNPVDPTRDYYIFTFQRSGGEIREQRVVMYYENDRFSHYEAELLETTPAY